jgi:hypothetical protein
VVEKKRSTSALLLSREVQDAGRPKIAAFASFPGRPDGFAPDDARIMLSKAGVSQKGGL